ncbi:helix-hairpin-helix domain-containing protein [Brotaphodocola sp.]|uniref:helix-hairpin-helix domain-containing protein n=1 Tax=Brotaphodocola sp. TaxID=3073577 RepID=UPI003D7E93E4
MNTKESGLIGKSGILRWVILAVFLLAAGCLFSCGASEVSMEIALSSTDASDEAPAETAQNAKDEMLTESGTETESETFAEKETTKKTATESTVENTAENTENVTEPKADCFVYVCGEVKSPGVYCMENGKRIFEAVEQAGGFTDEAVREYLNLADEICDGMKIFVPGREQVQSGQIPADGFVSFSGGDGSRTNAGGRTGAGNAGTVSEKINLNTASKEELMTLSGIGSARAEDIIQYREQHGRFQRIEDIKKISGIKDAAFEKIKDRITV